MIDPMRHASTRTTAVAFISDSFGLRRRFTPHELPAGTVIPKDAGESIPSFKRGLRADGGHEPVHRRNFLFATAALLATSLAHGQQTQKVRRIGYLSTEAAESEPGRRNQGLLRESLRRVGYEEGRNLTIEWRFAEGKPDRLDELAQDLVRRDVELIVAFTNAPILAAQVPDQAERELEDTRGRGRANRRSPLSFAAQQRSLLVCARDGIPQSAIVVDHAL